MSRPARRKVSDGTATRDAILSAAVDILHREGAGALTMRSVAAAAGCSTTGVYTWFGGKNGLVEAIFVDGFKRFGEALLENHASPPDNWHFARLGEDYRAWALANPTHYMVMFGGAVPDFVPSDEARVAAVATFDHLVDSMRRVMAEQRLEGNPVDIAHHLWAGIHGYVSLEITGMDLADDEAMRDRRFRSGMALLVSGLLPPP
jgi:AcrR family transcriptional regulator